MSNSTHYENANFLRELAESLPRILPTGSADKAALLQRLANEELEQAEYEERVRTKVEAARADTRPGMSTDQLRQQLLSRYQELRDAV
ncbi:TPA: plasmid stabilization protein [Escherichia coli]|nr:plasmid stabilization protein [Salmonella enterica subsp. enterica serovar Duisburg]EKI9341972.1 plasmid stabilization protein [Escherichia coli]HBC0520432.1 plasmid stabilization protein [Escherichia coli]HDZ1372147.1 plasmid stabilization protein [Klebsiella pneumoniae]